MEFQQKKRKAMELKTSETIEKERKVEIILDGSSIYPQHSCSRRDPDPSETTLLLDNLSPSNWRDLRI